MPLSLCSSCRLPSSSVVTNLPCEECLGSLLASPAICPDCLGFTCPSGTCARPWLAVSGETGNLRFDSVTAAYLSVGPGARVLKTWKTSPSPSLDRFLRDGVRRGLAAHSPAAPLCLIPVPQSAERRWALAGGSALRLCEMILEVRKNPDDRVAYILELGTRARAQALTRGDERYSRRAAINARATNAIEEEAWASEIRSANPRFVLIDDFLTSGATLRAAASAARGKLAELDVSSGRNVRLDVFVLGFRPALFGDGFH